jgi:hypothetical protein
MRPDEMLIEISFPALEKWSADFHEAALIDGRRSVKRCSDRGFANGDCAHNASITPGAAALTIIRFCDASFPRMPADSPTIVSARLPAEPVS